MIVNFNTKLRNLAGKQVDLTLKEVSTKALTATYKDEKLDKDAIKNRWSLAKKIETSDKGITISDDEAMLIQDLIAKAFVIQVSAPALESLQPQPKG